MLVYGAIVIEKPRLDLPADRIAERAAPVAGEIRRRRGNSVADQLDGQELFFAHVHLHGGPAPVRRYLPDLSTACWTERSIRARCSIYGCRSPK